MRRHKRELIINYELSHLYCNTRGVFLLFLGGGGGGGGGGGWGIWTETTHQHRPKGPTLKSDRNDQGRNDPAETIHGRNDSRPKRYTAETTRTAEDFQWNSSSFSSAALNHFEWYAEAFGIHNAIFPTKVIQQHLKINEKEVNAIITYMLNKSAVLENNGEQLRLTLWQVITATAWASNLTQWLSFCFFVVVVFMRMFLFYYLFIIILFIFCRVNFHSLNHKKIWWFQFILNGSCRKYFIRFHRWGSRWGIMISE